MSKARIAWFSPLSGPSSSWYTSKQLLPYLSRWFEIECFHDGQDQSLSLEGTEIAVFHYLKARLRDRSRPFDAFIYHIEDRPECGFARIHVGLIPGIAWVHDFFMTTHGPEPILNSSWRETIRRFKDSSVTWPPRGTEFVPAGAYAAREVGVSALAVFSTPRDRAEAGRLLTDGRLDERGRSSFIPHPVPQALFELVRDARALRTIGISGRPVVECQIHSVFEALRQLPNAITAIWPVAAHDRERAEALCVEFELQGRCQIVIGDTHEDWIKILPMIDLGILLRFSAFGQVQPRLALTLASGCPAIITDFGSGEAVPEHACFKIPPGRDTARYVVEIVSELSDENIRRRAGDHGRRYAREFNHPLYVAESLRRVLSSNNEYLATVRAEWGLVERAAHTELLQEIERISPVASEGVLAAPLQQERRSAFKELGWLCEGGAP